MKSDLLPILDEATQEWFNFPSRKVSWVFNRPFSELTAALDPSACVIITDANIFKHYENLFGKFRVYVIKPGEGSKQQATVDNILVQLLEWELNKTDIIIGIGGGVVTDIAGYVASVYKRGTRLFLVPTSLLGMVDAALGGKNGVDAGVFKNMIGTVYQPHLLWYDLAFLQTLPQDEWRNGFAEIIKHACINSAEMFNWLEENNPDFYQQDEAALCKLIAQNVQLKMQIVLQDEMDRADRQLLNFGHTLGHAIEKKLNIPHGQAISVGMVAAGEVSKKMNGFSDEEQERLVKLLQQYGLPVACSFTEGGVLEALRKDKKREKENIRFVLLESIGNAQTSLISIEILREYLPEYL